MFRSDKEGNKSEEDILNGIKQRVEEIIETCSSIQMLHEDIEKCKPLLFVYIKYGRSRRKRLASQGHSTNG